MKFPALAGLLLLSLFPVSAGAQLPHATPELVSAAQTARPGESFDLAIVFHIEPEWHLYWLNPGDSGLAPTVKWTLPKGVTIADLEFPTPKRIRVAENLVSFGYEDQLVLLARVQLADDVTKNFEIGASLNWLVCKEQCVAESTLAAIKVNVGDQSVPSRKNDFAQWRAQLPSDRPVKSVYSIEPDQQSGKFSVELPAEASEIDLFPPAAPFADYQKPSIERLDHQNRVTIPFRVLPGNVEKLQGDGIVTFKTPDGVRHSWKVPVDFRPAK